MFEVIRRSSRRFVSRMKYDVLGIGASAHYERIGPHNELATVGGWLANSVAERQHNSYTAHLDEMYRGNPRRDLQVAASAIDESGLPEPMVLEVGCGSGYYAEVFERLCETRVSYYGTDFSPPMIHKAIENYPPLPFVISDATTLPFQTDAFDIVLNGNALMHMPAYEKAIGESARVARDWSIFHSVPVIDSSDTIRLRKDAYGEPTIELLFNRYELCSRFDDAGLTVERVYDSIDYRLPYHIVDEEVAMQSFLCRVE